MLYFKAQNLSNSSQNNKIIKNSISLKEKKYLVAVTGRKLISYKSIDDHPEGEITF